MTIYEARLIREIKKRATYRRLTEIYYSKKEPGYGNQLFGQDLCHEALNLLYPGFSNMDQNTRNKLNKNKKFYSDNKSHIGDFYWWE